MENKNPKKPLCLEIEEAKNELNSTVEHISSKHGLPCYLLELLVSDLLSRLQNGSRIEKEQAQRSYERQCAESGEADVE